MKNTAIVGLGNNVMSDEGVGLAVLEHLQQVGLPSEDATLVFGGTSGLILIPELKEFERILFVDAAEFGGKPGDIRVFSKEELSLARPAMPTAHDVGLSDLLGSLMLLTGRSPEAWLVGIQVGKVGLGTRFSEAVGKAILPAAEAVRRLLEN